MILLTTQVEDFDRFERRPLDQITIVRLPLDTKLSLVLRHEDAVDVERRSTDTFAACR